MARIDKRALTELEILQTAFKYFIDKGFSNTSIRSICSELDMSPGNLTFYFPTKEHLLAGIVDMLCDFRYDMFNDCDNSIFKVCMEFVSIMAMCEISDEARDFYLSLYINQLSVEAIRKNDIIRAKEILKPYTAGWTDEEFEEAQILISGIEYATIMATGSAVPFSSRINGALNNILDIYGVPKEHSHGEIEKMLALDYRSLGQQSVNELKLNIERINEESLRKVLIG